jgi:hypothetical protein
MATRKHTHDIQIDAPVEEVFGYIEEPDHFIAACPQTTTPASGQFNARRTGR